MIGGRCGRCEATTFPMQSSCPRCGDTGMGRVLLPRTGTLWTWTTQEF
ncbi:Zn-ribbon domain-containing OB-fold protein, partial [Actinomadura rugatobispora]